MKPTILTTAVLLSLTSIANAGVLMTGTEKNSNTFGPMGSRQKITEEKTKIYLDSDKVRMDQTSSEGDTTVIYKKDKNIFWMIDNQKKTYTEMTKKDLEHMKNQLKSAMSQQFGEALNGMSAEEKEMMAKMMGGLTDNIKNQMKNEPVKQKTKVINETKTVYKKIGSGQKVGKWTCDEYAGYDNKIKVEQVCVINWKKIDLRTDDFKVFNEIVKFFDVFSLGEKQNASMSYDLKKWEKDLGYPGFPVKTITYENEKVTSISLLDDIHRESFASSLFIVPSGYTKEAMDMNGSRAVSSEEN